MEQTPHGREEREGAESAETLVVVKRSWEEARRLDERWKREAKEYPQRELTELLLARAYPRYKKQSIVEKVRKAPPRITAMVGGRERDIAIVDQAVPDQQEFKDFEGIATSRLTDAIVIAKGFGPCPFLIGFREGRGFVAHILARAANRSTIDRLLTHVGIPPHDESSMLVGGGGQAGGRYGDGQSASTRRALFEGARMHGVSIQDINARRDASKTTETTAVAIDPQKNLAVILVSEEIPTKL